jgi:general secretion pathway protein G
MHRILLNNRNKGFTLIELLVVIAIIGFLSSVVLASLNTARAKARDSRRIQDIVQLRTALEMYYNANGSYPSPNPYIWGGVSTDPCGSNSTNYINGLVPTYIPKLPVDPGPAGSCNGYLYNSNTIHYKLLIHASWEGTYPTAGQAFYDPVRPTWALMVCDEEPACSTW